MFNKLCLTLITIGTITNINNALINEYQNPLINNTIYANETIQTNYELSSNNNLKNKEEIKDISKTFILESRKFNSSKFGNIDYWFYTPNQSNTKDLPLIIYLHGLDGCTNNINTLTTIEGLPYYINKGYFYPNAIVIAPQCPTKSWNNVSSSLMELIEYVANSENIDKDKISITGASLGGIGTFDMAIKYPNYFSCAVPLCASITPSRCSNLVNLPIKIFHGTEDYGMGFSVIEANKVINTNGGNSTITLLQGEGHEIRHVYIDEEYDLINWMIQQDREENGNFCR